MPMDFSQPETIAVIDYGMGNLRSVANALKHVGARVRVVTRPDEVAGAAGLILPGVGALEDCISALNQSGLADTVRAWIAADQPFLGVCLGLQALFEHSEEANVRGLGIFAGQVVRFKLKAPFKIPHMGWNAATFSHEDPVMNTNIRSGIDQFYFVHSYHVQTGDADLVWATTDYGSPFVSAIHRGNTFATQFHPERSQTVGLQIYRNFNTLVQKHAIHS